MTPDELKARARRFAEELLTQGDLAVAGELFDVDCNHQAPHSETSGVDGVKRWVLALRRAFPDLRAIVEDEIAEGDVVMHRLTFSGTHEAALFDMPPNSRHATWHLVEILRVGPDGKFTEHWCIWDELDLLRQLGTVPTAAEKTS
jgi:predicted ester cyclase